MSAVLLFLILLPSTSATWPFYGHDLHHSFSTNAVGPSTQPRESWLTNLDSSSIESSPIFSLDGSGLFVGTRASSVYRLSTTNGAIVWTSKDAGCELSSPTLSLTDGAHLYCGSLNGKFTALDTVSGTMIWTYLANGQIWSSSTPFGSLIYFGSFALNGNGGSIHAVNAITGLSVWTVATSDTVRAAPMIANEILYIGDYSDKFWALDILTGDEIWHITVSDSVRSSASYFNDIVIFGCYDNSVYALNASDGTVIWTAPTQNWVQSSPSIHELSNSVIVGSWDKNLYRFNITDGSLLWKVNTGSSLWAPAVIDGANHIFIGTEGGLLLCLDVITGDRLWSLSSFNGALEATTIINDNDGSLFVATGNGTVQKFT